MLQFRQITHCKYYVHVYIDNLQMTNYTQTKEQQYPI